MMHTPPKRSFIIPAVAALLVAAGVGSACNKSSDKPAGDADAKVTKKNGASAASGADGLVGAITFAAALPQDTVGVWAVNDPAALFDTHIRPALTRVDEFNKGLTMAGLGSTAMLGVDLTEFKNLKTLGVDPNGQWGVALLSEVGMVWAVRVPLTSAADFEKALAQQAERIGKVTWETVGKVKRGKVAGVDVVITGDSAFAVAAMMASEALVKSLDALTSVDPAKSLATHPRFRADWAALQGELAATKAAAGVSTKNLFGWIHSGPVIDVVGKRDNDRRAAKFTPSSERIEQLAAAKAAANTEAIAKVQARIDEDKGDFERRRQRRDAGAFLMANTLGGFETLVGAGEFSGKGVDGVMRASLRKDRALAGLFNPTTGVPETIQRLSQRPAASLHLVLNKTVAKTYLDKMFAAEGDSLAETSKEFQKLSGVSLVDELWPALGSEVGFAVTLDPEAIAQDGNDSKGFGGALLFKVADAPKLVSALEKMVAKGVLKKGGAARTWELPVANWHTVALSLAEGWLAMDVAKTFSDNGGFANKLSEPEKTRFLATDASAVMSWKQLASAYLFILNPGGLSLTISGDQTGKDEAKLEQLQTLVDGANKEAKAASATRISATLKMMDLIGGTVMNATPRKSAAGEAAWMIAGGMFPGAPTIGEAMDKAVATFKAMQAAMAIHETKRRTARAAAEKLAKELGLSVRKSWVDMPAAVAEEPAKSTVSDPAVAPKTP